MAVSRRYFFYFAAGAGALPAIPQLSWGQSYPTRPVRMIVPYAAGSATDTIARIITQVKKQKIPAVFLDNITDSRLMERIAQESGARIGGKLYSDALTDAKGDAPSYIELMRHNVKQISAALMS